MTRLYRQYVKDQPEAELPPICLEVQDALLDDPQKPILSEGLAQHLAQCPDCIDFQKIAPLLRGLGHRSVSDMPTPLSVDALFDAVQQDRLGRRRLQIGLGTGLSLVAASVLWFWVIPILTRTPEQQVRVVSRSVTLPQSESANSTPTRGIQDSIVEAKTTLIALTQKPLEIASLPDPASVLRLPISVQPDLPFKNLSNVMEPLNHIGNGAMLSFQPIGNSARRAMNMLRRELGDELSPSSNPR